EVAALHSRAARRTPIKMILFGQIAHAMANVLPARELDNPAVLFSHLVCADTRPQRLQRAESREPVCERSGLRLATRGAPRRFQVTPAASSLRTLLSRPASRVAA